MSQLNPFQFPGSDLFSPAPTRPAVAPPIPSLSPEDEQNLLEKLGHAGLGGLSFIGGILNKPGRIIRGALGGHARELLNAIPFSDALGITKPEDEVRGSHLLHNLGLTDEKDPNLLSGAGAAGFGVDVLTDPLSWISGPGAALTKAGLIAKKAGVLPASVGARIAGATPEIEAATQGAVKAGEKLGGHIGFGVPGSGANNLGTLDLRPLGNAINSGVRAVPGGNALADFAGTVGGAASDLYSRTIPPLFQRAVKGQTSPVAQAAARESYEAAPGAQAAVRRQMSELAQSMPSYQATGKLDPLEGNALRSALETPGAPTGPLAPQVQQMRDLLDKNLQRRNYLGHPDLPYVDPEVAYAPRQTVFSEAQRTGGARDSMVPPGQGPARELPKGTKAEYVNTLSSDPSLLPQRQAYIAGNKQPWLDTAKKTFGVDQAQLDALRQQSLLHNPTFQGTPFPHADKLAAMEARAVAAEATADWIAKSVPEDLATKGIGAFGRHPILDLTEKLVKEAPGFLDTEALHKSVAGMAYLGGDGAPLSDVLHAAGLTFKDSQGNLTAMSRTLEAMQAQGKLPAGASLKDLADWTIPHDQVSKLTKFVRASTTPEGLAPFLKIWDSITNLTKTFQTTLWPANAARNKGQAVFQNWMIDGFNAHAPTGMGYIKPYEDAVSWAKNKTIEGSSQYPGLQHLTDEAATKVLQSEIHSLNVASAFKNPEADIVGGDVTLRQLMPDLPGGERKGFGEILKGALPTSRAEANPLNVAGFNGRTEDVFAPVRAGREFSAESHAQDRVATYLAKRSQGYTPEAALKEVKLAHYDFANMTGFEKDVMKRVIPFYNFARQNVPAVLNEIFENPGGKLATTLKGVNEAKGEHPGFIPQQISGGIAAPLGQEENGQKRYLTHLGLGFEDLGNLTGPGGPLGLLNPLIKAPIESLTGKQLISGRDLADLHSRIGDATGVTPPPLLENLLTNSPIGRAVGTVSTLEDPRKSALDKLINLGTGARVSDVDVEASRRRAVLDAITSQLHGPNVRRFESLSVKPEDFAQMDPLSQHLYQLYRSLQKKGAQVPALQ